VTLNQITKAIYALYIINYFGFKIKQNKTQQNQRKYRFKFSKSLLDSLSIDVKVLNEEKLPKSGQFLLVSNHKSVLDPVVIELALQKSDIFGHWIAKKELYNSFFFGLFTRNAGTILLDRESKQMGHFFADIKEVVKKGDSIFIFPEGTRNKTKNSLLEFQDGAQLIALKNRLPILPLYIKTDAHKVLMDSLQNKEKHLTIEIEVGDIIDYKDRSEKLQQRYKKMFHL